MTAGGINRLMGIQQTSNVDQQLLNPQDPGPVDKLLQMLAAVGKTSPMMGYPTISAQQSWDQLKAAAPDLPAALVQMTDLGGAAAMLNRGAVHQSQWLEQARTREDVHPLALTIAGILGFAEPGPTELAKLAALLPFLPELRTVGQRGFREALAGAPVGSTRLLAPEEFPTSKAASMHLSAASREPQLMGADIVEFPNAASTGSRLGSGEGLTFVRDVQNSGLDVSNAFNDVAQAAILRGSRFTGVGIGGGSDFVRVPFDVILEGKLGRKEASYLLGLNREATYDEFKRAADQISEFSRRTLAEKGWPEEFVVYRGGPLYDYKGTSIIPVTTDFRVAEGFGVPRFYKVRRDDVLANVENLTRTPESELLFRSGDMQPLSFRDVGGAVFGGEGSDVLMMYPLSAIDRPYAPNPFQGLYHNPITTMPGVGADEPWQLMHVRNGDVRNGILLKFPSRDDALFATEADFSLRYNPRASSDVGAFVSEFKVTDSPRMPGDRPINFGGQRTLAERAYIVRLPQESIHLAHIVRDEVRKGPLSTFAKAPGLSIELSNNQWLSQMSNVTGRNKASVAHYLQDFIREEPRAIQEFGIPQDAVDALNRWDAGKGKQWQSFKNTNPQQQHKDVWNKHAASALTPESKLMKELDEQIMHTFNANPNVDAQLLDMTTPGAKDIVNHPFVKKLAKETGTGSDFAAGNLVFLWTKGTTPVAGELLDKLPNDLKGAIGEYVINKGAMHF